jgi:CheY-like chemotaxis protein
MDQLELHLKIFKAYAGQQRIVVADASSVSRVAISSTLSSLGALTSNISLANTFAEAEKMIASEKPRIVIADYDIGKQRGLDLLQKQRAQQPESKDCLFILVTGNTSQTAVARAAEEDVDTYILKPFSLETLKMNVLKAAILKLKPSPYLKVIEAGKELLTAGKIDEALVQFETAKKLNPTPALACFYIGQAQLMKKAVEAAEGSYNTGLIYNKIHYKCLVGLFDVFMSRNMHKEAYEVIRKISHYFPANPTRMTQVLRLAILTKSYDDVEKYYQIFTTLDDRNEEMIKYICAALVVCGKHYLHKRLGSRARQLFAKAITTASGRTRVLRDVILSLLEFDRIEDANEFLKKFPMDTHSGTDYLTMKLLLLDRSEAGALALNEAKELIKNGIEDPLIYRVLIRRHSESGSSSGAEEYFNAAQKKFPEYKEQFSEDLSKLPGAKKQSS